MHLPQTEKNGTTRDSPAREHTHDAHGESLNWRGGRGGRGGRRWGGRGGRGNGPRGNDDRWSWRRDGAEAEGVPQRRGQSPEGNAPAAERRGGRGGFRGPRHYDPREEGFASWRRGEAENGESAPMYQRDERRGGRGRGGRGRGGRGAYRHPQRDDDAQPHEPQEEEQTQPPQQQQQQQQEREQPPQQQQQKEQPPQQQQHQQTQPQQRREDPISTNPNRTQRAPNLRKNCYNESEVEQLFDHHHQQKGISLDNYANIPVDIVPRDVEPVESFEDLFVEPALSINIAKCGYKQPTPVQRYGIPVCLKGADLMACAQTGSGKTAAFLVPVVHYILKIGVSPARNRVSHPIAVIMAPTRELALQIFDEVRKLTFRTDIFHDVVYGGTPYPTRFENDILVACPGRLKDIFDRNMLSFSQVKFLVLDEADRMLEMGFEEQIEYLVASRYTDMPPVSDRQTLMFSATFPQRILNLAKRYLRQQYYLLTVGRVGSTTKNITQRLERVQDNEKTDKLFEIIYQQKQTDLVLIFVETKLAAENLHYALKTEGIPSATIHGDRKQTDRERALRDFKDGVTPILVATDVASRGLDIPNVAHVIQYDLPKEMDDYTHRIGRTGRAGNKGIATSFYNRNNRSLAAELYNYLREHEQEVPVWLEEEKELVEADRFIGMNRQRGNRRGGGDDGFRAVPERTNATWGEAKAPQGGRTRGGGRAQAGGANVDDGGF